MEEDGAGAAYVQEEEGIEGLDGESLLAEEEGGIDAPVEEQQQQQFDEEYNNEGGERVEYREELEEDGGAGAGGQGDTELGEGGDAISGMDLYSYASGMISGQQDDAGQYDVGAGGDPQGLYGVEPLANDEEADYGGEDGEGFDMKGDFEGGYGMQQPDQGEDGGVQQRQEEEYDANSGGEEEEDDVDDLPLFANEQTKALHAEIKRKEARVEELEELLVEGKERVKVMDEHLKNVAQEVEHTNALMESKKKERESERHMMLLAIRECGRYRQEVKQFDLEAEELQDKFTIAQNAVFRANEKMDQFKLQMNWNQDELEQWALAARQKEEDNIQLQKYTRADEVKTKELSLHIEKLSKAAVEKRALLEAVTAAAASRQMELDRAAEEFRQIHSGRQDLVHKWQDNIDAMRQRDEEINGLGAKYATARKHRAQRRELLQQNVARLKMQEDDNKEVQQQIEQLERLVATKREENLRAQRNLVELKDELDVLKNTLASSASALVQKRSANALLEERVEALRKALETARLRYKAAKQKVEMEAVRTLNAEESAAAAESELKRTESNLKSAERHLSASKEAMFKESQKLYAYRQEEANLISGISSCQSAIRNLQSRVHQLDMVQMRQQEQIYTSEFKIQQMERKVARGLGERSDEEKIILNARIKELEMANEQAKEQKRLLVAQARKLNNELRGAMREREAAVKRQTRLEEEINELKLECTAEELILKKVISGKEEMMVNNDVMRLEMKRLRDILNGRADEVYSLENRQQQLAMSMEERKSEIQVHRDIQSAMLRAAEEERRLVAVELGQRKQHVMKLRSKYETVSKTGSGDGSGESDNHSQAFLIIKAAQRREELQREGDELDHQIRTCEREMRALSSTLQHLNARNVDHRMSFNKVDRNCEDVDMLRHLEQQTKLAQDALFRRKKELQRLQTDYEEDAFRLDSLLENTARMEEQNSHLANAYDQVQKDVTAQQELLQKAKARLEKARKQHRDKAGISSGGEPTLTEKKLRADALSDTVSNALYTLGQLAQEFPEMQDVLHTHLKKAGLTIPSKPGPLRNSSAAGTGSLNSARSDGAMSSSSKGSKSNASRVSHQSGPSS